LREDQPHVVIPEILNAETISLHSWMRASSPLPLSHLPYLFDKNRVGQTCPPRFMSIRISFALYPSVYKKLQLRRRNDGVQIAIRSDFSVMSGLKLSYFALFEPQGNALWS